MLAPFPVHLVRYWMENIEKDCKCCRSDRPQTGRRHPRGNTLLAGARIDTQRQPLYPKRDVLADRCIDAAAIGEVEVHKVILRNS